MVKIYPENIKNGDELYILMKTIVYGLSFCVCVCVGLIIVIVSSIENDIDNGSY